MAWWARHPQTQSPKTGTLKNESEVDYRSEKGGNAGGTNNQPSCTTVAYGAMNAGTTFVVSALTENIPIFVVTFFPQIWERSAGGIISNTKKASPPPLQSNPIVSVIPVSKQHFEELWTKTPPISNSPRSNPEPGSRKIRRGICQKRDFFPDGVYRELRSKSKKTSST